MSPMVIWYAIITLAVFLALWRVYAGPEAASRAVAVDVMTSSVAGIMVLFALDMNKAYLLDIALVYSILAFVMVLALARYIERGI